VVDAESGMLTMAKSCLHVCNQGACLFKNCTYTRCPGGACHFIDSKYPSCDGKSQSYLVLSSSSLPQLTFTVLHLNIGGACIFERCTGATCGGGRYTKLLNLFMLGQG